MRHISARNKDDPSAGVLGDNVTGGRQTVQFPHRDIHQDRIGTQLVIGVDRLGAGIDDFQNVMFRRCDEQRQSAADTGLVIGNQDPHRLNLQNLPCHDRANLSENWEIEPAKKFGSRGRIRRCLPLYFAAVKQLIPE